MAGKPRDKPSKCRLDKDEAAQLYHLACLEALGRISKLQRQQLNELLTKLKATGVSTGPIRTTP